MKVTKNVKNEIVRLYIGLIRLLHSSKNPNLNCILFKVYFTLKKRFSIFVVFCMGVFRPHRSLQHMCKVSMETRRGCWTLELGCRQIQCKQLCDCWFSNLGPLEELLPAEPSLQLLLSSLYINILLEIKFIFNRWLSNCSENNKTCIGVLSCINSSTFCITLV